MLNEIKDQELNEVSGGTKLPYIVQPGDTLAKIAAKYNCSVEQLCRWNNIQNPDMLLVNQQLIIKF